MRLFHLWVLRQDNAQSSKTLWPLKALLYCSSCIHLPSSDLPLMPQTPPVRVLPVSAYCSTTLSLASARKCCTIAHETRGQKEKEKVITWVRPGCMDCLPSSLPPHQLILLVSGRADRAGQPASGVSGLATLEAESLAAPVDSFYFPGKLSGDLETPWMRPTRPVWLTAARWKEESFWFSLVHEQVAEMHWSQSLEDKALPSEHLIRVPQSGWRAQHQMTWY